MPPFLATLGIKGMIAVGCAIALALMAFTIHLKNNKIESQRNQIAAVNAKLAISNGSIDLLTATIGKLNAEAKARADAFENSRKLAAQEAQALETKAKGSQAQIDRLRALAARGGTCAVPADLSGALEGL